MNITPVIHSVELLLLPRIEIETLLEGCFSVHYWVMKQLISVFVAKSRATWLHCFAEVGGGLLRAVFRPLSVFVQGL